MHTSNCSYSMTQNIGYQYNTIPFAFALLLHLSSSAGCFLEILVPSSPLGKRVFARPSASLRMPSWCVITLMASTWCSSPDASTPSPLCPLCELCFCFLGDGGNTSLYQPFCRKSESTRLGKPRSHTVIPVEFSEFVL